MHGYMKKSTDASILMERSRCIHKRNRSICIYKWKKSKCMDTWKESICFYLNGKSLVASI